MQIYSYSSIPRHFLTLVKIYLEILSLFCAYWKRGIQLNYTIMVDLINKKDLYTITIILIALKFIHFNIAIPDMCFISYNVSNFKSGHDRYFWIIFINKYQIFGYHSFTRCNKSKRPHIHVIQNVANTF